MGDKCKSMRPRAPRVGDKYGRQVGDKCKIMRPRQPRVGDKWETSVKSCGPEHPEWNASRETKAKSCGPGTQPFERSKNPIQVNLFGEKHTYFEKWVFSSDFLLFHHRAPQQKKPSEPPPQSKLVNCCASEGRRTISPRANSRRCEAKWRLGGWIKKWMGTNWLV